MFNKQNDLTGWFTSGSKRVIIHTIICIACNNRFRPPSCVKGLFCCWVEKSSLNPRQTRMVVVVLARPLRKPLVSFTGLFTSKTKDLQPCQTHRQMLILLSFICFQVWAELPLFYKVINLQCSKKKLLIANERRLKFFDVWQQLRHDLRRTFCSSDFSQNN